MHTALIQAEAELSIALKAYSSNKISIAKEKRWIELEQMAKAAVIKVGEEIIIMGFELSEQPFSPKIILVNQQNKFEKYL